MWLPELIKFCCWFLPPTSFSVDSRDRSVVVKLPGGSAAHEQSYGKADSPSHVCPWLLWFASSQVPERVTIHFRISVVRPKGKTQKACRVPPGAATTVPWAPNLGIVLSPIQSFPRNRKKKHLRRQLVRYQQIPKKYSNETHFPQPRNGSNGPSCSNASSLMALLLGSSQGPLRWDRPWPLILQGNLRRGHFYFSHSFISLHPSTKHGHLWHFPSSSVLQATAVVIDLIDLGAPKASVANNSKGSTSPLVLGFFLTIWLLGSLFPL